MRDDGNNSRDDESDEGDLDGEFAAQTVVQVPKTPRADAGCDVDDDAEEQDFFKCEAIRACRINAAEGKDGDQAVVIDEACDQEFEDFAVVLEFAEGLQDASVGCGQTLVRRWFVVLAFRVDQKRAGRLKIANQIATPIFVARMCSWVSLDRPNHGVSADTKPTMRTAIESRPPK